MIGVNTVRLRNGTRVKRASGPAMSARAALAVLLVTAILAGCGGDTTPGASMLPMVNKAGQVVFVPRALANLLGSAAANQVPSP